MLTDRTVYDGERRYLDPHLATSRGRPGAEAVQVEPGEENLRRRCAPRAALGGDPQRPRRDGRARPRRRRRLPVRDGRGRSASRTTRPTSPTSARALQQGHREGDLDDRHPRGARLRPPVLRDRRQARARRDPRRPRLRRLRAAAASASPTSTTTPTSARGSSPARRTPSRRRRSASTRRSGRRRSPPPTAPAPTRSTREKVRELEAESPISMRHVDGPARADREPIDPADRSTPAVGHHDYPIVISSMSFGSQGETAFRAYAEAAKRDQHALHQRRGRRDPRHVRPLPQVARPADRLGPLRRLGRADQLLLRASRSRSARAPSPARAATCPARRSPRRSPRRATRTPGTDLISPSNNHDLYSIEDLAELIDELKTVNPDVRVSVKVPVVPNIGTIGLGIAKAGADIITLSGFEGGTGAARQHALRHVGLPSRHRHPRRAPRADGGRASATGSRSGPTAATATATTSSSCTASAPTGWASAPWRWSPRLHDLPRLPARHLPRRHRHADRDDRAGAGARPEEVHPAGGRPTPSRAAPASSRRWARRSGRSSPSSATSAPRTSSAATTCSCRSRHHDAVDLAPADHAAGGVPRPRAARPAGRRRRRPRSAPRPAWSSRRADPDGGRSRPRPQIAALGRRRSAPGRTVRSEYPRPTDANDRVLGTELAGGDRRGAHLRRRPERPTTTCSPASSFNGGSVAGQGLGAFNVYGVVDPRRGRRPGRRRQGDARRHDRGAQGQERRRQAGQRLGRQVLRLRRPARPPLRPGLRRLALLHPPLGRRRRARRRARASRSTTPAAASPTAPTSRASPSST